MSNALITSLDGFPAGELKAVSANADDLYAIGSRDQFKRFACGRLGKLSRTCESGDLNSTSYFILDVNLQQSCGAAIRIKPRARLLRALGPRPR